MDMLRHSALRICSNSKFEMFMLLTILLNAILLATYDPINTNGNAIVKLSEIVFLSMYTCEMLLKILAFGLYWDNPKSYLRHGFNVMDAFVVIGGWVSFALTASANGSNAFVAALRLLRLLRPLQALGKAFPSMAWVFSALFRSLPQLGSAVILLLLLFAIASIVGVVFFQGVLKQKCGEVVAAVVIIPGTERNRFCSFGYQKFGRHCPIGMNLTCMVVTENPNLGVTNFDNAYSAFIVINQIVTMEGWGQIMHWIADTNGEASQIFFVIIVALGGIFIVAIFLAILAVNLTTQRQLITTKQIADSDAALERKLMERRLLSPKGVAEDLHVENAYRRFLKKENIDFTDAIQMRLILSYERMKDVEDYDLVTKTQHEEYLKNQTRERYEQWKRHALPLIDSNERMAAAKRRQDDRDERDELNRRSSRTINSRKAKDVMASNQSERMQSVTPPFITREIEIANVQENLKKQTDENITGAPVNLAVFRFSNSVSTFYGKLDFTPAGSRPNASRLRKKVFAIIRNRKFEVTCMIVIVLNSMLLASTFFRQPTLMFDMQRIGDYVFSGLFLFELITQMYGLGALCYWSNPWLQFDGVITLLSLIQYATPDANASIFRVLRLLYLFRLLNGARTTKVILGAFGKTVAAVAPFLLLVFIFVFAFAVIGMQLFGGTVSIPFGDPAYDCTPLATPYYPRCPPRKNYDSFYFSFLASFSLMVKNDWDELMFPYVAATSDASFLFFMVNVWVGAFVVLNIFLGILIDTFLESSHKHKMQMMEQLVEKTACDEESQNSVHAFQKRIEGIKGGDGLSAGGLSLSSTSLSGDLGKAASYVTSNLNLADGQVAVRVVPVDDAVAQSSAQTSGPTSKDTHGLGSYIRARRLHLEQKRQWHFVSHPSYQYRNSFGMSSSHPIRFWAGDFVLSPVFRAIVFLMIFVSSVALAFDAAYVSSDTRLILNFINAAVAGLFISEFLLKIFAFGVVLNPGAYARNPWSALEFSLVCILIVSLAVWGHPSESIVQSFRSILILRLAEFMEGLGSALRSVGRSVFPLCQVAMFSFVFFFAVAIVFVLFFQGELTACYVAAGGSIERDFNYTMCFDYPEYGVNCTALNRPQCDADKWTNPRLDSGSTFSFDNIFASLLYMFELSTLENWYQMMIPVMDVTGIGFNLVRDYSKFNAIAFIFLVFLFQVLLIQLFVTVVVDSFQETENISKARAFLSPRQNEWLRIQQLAWRLPFRAKLLSPTDQPRKAFHQLVTNKLFKLSIVGVIAFNTVVLLSLHANASLDYMIFYRTVDYLVGIVYILEAVMKIIAFGLGAYLYRSYNWFDLAVCVCTMIGWVYEPAFFPVQAVDSFRAFHLVYYFPGTRRILEMVTLSIPALRDVGGILLFVYYVFAVVGVAVFSHVTVEPSADGQLFLGLSAYGNFEHFSNALLTLFSMSTGDNWNGIMHDLTNARNPMVARFAYPYCIVFIVTVQFCLLNLVVAVIVFDIREEIANVESGKSSKVSRSVLLQYAKAWADVRFYYEQSHPRPRHRFTRQSTQSNLLFAKGRNVRKQEEDGRIKRGGGQRSGITFALRRIVYQSDLDHPQMHLPASQLPLLLTNLPPPLGLRGLRHVTRGDVLRIIRNLNIPVNRLGDIHYHTTLSTLIDRVVLDDVIVKTLKASLEPFGNLLHESKFDAATGELNDLLKLNLRTETERYRSHLGQVAFRPDGFDAARLIATKLLFRAADSYLRRRYGVDSTGAAVSSGAAKRQHTVGGDRAVEDGSNDKKVRDGSKTDFNGGKTIGFKSHKMHSKKKQQKDIVVVAQQPAPQRDGEEDA